MAEALVETMPNTRYYCYVCNTEINIPNQNFICPLCAGGFVEEIPEAQPVRNAVDGRSRTIVVNNQVPHNWLNDLNAILLNRFGPNMQIAIDPNMLRSGNNPVVADGNQQIAVDPTMRRDGNNPAATDGNQPIAVDPTMRHDGNNPAATDSNQPIAVDPTMRLDGNNPAAVSGSQPQASSRMLRNNAPNILIDFLNLLDTYANGPMLFIGNIGDYAWGRDGIDTIVTQLLNQMETAGPPPLPREKIDEVPKVKVTQEDVENNTQCSVCWEDFVLDETVRKLPCSHIYHENCIVPWLELHGTCPICRESLTRDEENDGNDDGMNGTSHGTNPRSDRNAGGGGGAGGSGTQHETEGNILELPTMRNSALDDLD